MFATLYLLSALLTASGFAGTIALIYGVLVLQLPLGSSVADVLLQWSLSAQLLTWPWVADYAHDWMALIVFPVLMVGSGWLGSMLSTLMRR